MFGPSAVCCCRRRCSNCRVRARKSVVGSPGTRHYYSHKCTRLVRFYFTKAITCNVTLDLRCYIFKCSFNRCFSLLYSMLITAFPMDRSQTVVHGINRIRLESCDATCAKQSLLCEASALADLISISLFEDIDEASTAWSCGSYFQEVDDDYKIISPSTFGGNCYYTNPGVGTCAGSINDFSTLRICPCFDGYDPSADPTAAPTPTLAPSSEPVDAPTILGGRAWILSDTIGESCADTCLNQNPVQVCDDDGLSLVNSDDALDVVADAITDLNCDVTGEELDANYYTIAPSYYAIEGNPVTNCHFDSLGLRGTCAGSYNDGIVRRICPCTDPPAPTVRPTTTATEMPTELPTSTTTPTTEMPTEMPTISMSPTTEMPTEMPTLSRAPISNPTPAPNTPTGSTSGSTTSMPTTASDAHRTMFDWAVFNASRVGEMHTFKASSRYNLLGTRPCRILENVERGHLVPKDGAIHVGRMVHTNTTTSDYTDTTTSSSSSSSWNSTMMNGYAKLSVLNRPMRVDRTILHLALGSRGDKQNVFHWQQRLMEDTNYVKFMSDKTDATSNQAMAKGWRHRDVEFVWQLDFSKPLVDPTGVSCSFEKGDKYYIEVQVVQGRDVRMCVRIKDFVIE